MSTPEHVQAPGLNTAPAGDFSSASFNLDFLRQQMPDWLRQAPPVLLAQLAASMRASEASRAARTRLLAPLRSIQAFAAPRFSAALKRRFGTRLSEATDRFERGDMHLDGFTLPIYRPVWKRSYIQQDLLQAALHNFTPSQAASGSVVSRSSQFLRKGRPLGGVDVVAFIALCRELDLGGQYQRHIDGVFNPDGNAGIPQSTRDLFKACDRYALQVDAHLARIRGTLGTAAHQHMLDVSEQKRGINEQGLALRYKRLKLAGFALNGISLFEFSLQPVGHLAGIEQPWARLIVHIPEDPQCPLKEYSGWREFEADLASRLANDHYQRFFLRFVTRRQWPAFHQQLARRLFQQQDGRRVRLEAPSLSLDGPLRRADLFDELFDERLSLLKDDGRFLAVPTAELEAAERQATLDKALALGMDVLGLAAFIVPGVGQALFGVVVAQLMGEVFVGLEDWAEGDRHEALKCLTQVVGEVAGLAAGAVVVAGAATLVRNSTLFRRLALVRLDNGTQRLCNPDLAPYAVQLDPALAGTPSGQGIYLVDGQQFVRIDGSYYRVEQTADAGTWRVRHPVRDDAWVPALEHNGQGAWRSRFDSPRQWQGSQYLFRRLGHSVDDFSDEEVTALLAISGTDEAQLRQWHLQQRTPAGALREAFARVRLQRRLQGLDEQLRTSSEVADDVLVWRLLQSMASEALAEGDAARLGEQMQRWLQENWQGFFEHCMTLERPAARSVLTRDFPGLAPAIAEEIEAGATATERLAMDSEVRLPMRLARQARQALRESRLDRALEGFFWPQMANADCDRLLLHALMEDPQWPPSLKLHIADTQAVPQSRELIRRGRRYIDSQQPDAPARDLLELARELAGFAPQVHLQDLRRQLGVQISQQRDLARRVLGEAGQRWWTPLQRLADGRLGYALSGRGVLAVAQRSIEEEILELYPDFSAEDITAFLEPYRARPAAARALLQRRRDELQRLRGTLQHWQAQPGSRYQADSRQLFANRLLGAWRRQVTAIHTPLGQRLGYSLFLGDLHVGALPSLESIDFSHIVELDLSGARLNSITPGFFEQFGRLRFLDLSGNALTRVPDGLERRLTLRHLRLRGNRITLDEAGARRMANMWGLETLDLTGNPLSQAPDLSRMTHLRVMQLRNTGIEQLPVGFWDQAALEALDLRDNRISHLPEQFFEEPRGFLRRVHLEGNPLPEAQQRRLLARQGLARPASIPLLRYSGEQYWAAPREIYQQLSNYWRVLQREPRAQPLLTLLERLAGMAEARGLREELRERVQAVLEVAVDSDLGHDLFLFVEDPQMLGREPLWVFSALEMRTQGYRALVDSLQTQTPERLIGFARSQFNLSRLERYLTALIQSQPEWWALQEDVQLAFRQALHERLGLPGYRQTTDFGDLGITQEHIAEAEEYVREGQPAELAHFLAHQGVWGQYLRLRHADAWHALEARFAEREELQRLREVALPAAERERRANARHIQQALDEDALMMQLTREAMGLPVEPSTAARGDG
ncbi:dermonecrotic toxin domain-containing protein [Pseudomonas sp. BJa5]|uniref:dermonecrotic toxin domain-containing protein n=1 Tax=Pseudomonas sp. BJa5 TaxID=2936270 RepID=UPI00255A2938|nr:DUF6543 domain-containing protein [Pseudomonas sp. BGr12]MDL2421120.1 hypothetical protein [Pseudomonas sp. BGr12]